MTPTETDNRARSGRRANGLLFCTLVAIVVLVLPPHAFAEIAGALHADGPSLRPMLLSALGLAALGLLLRKPRRG